MSAISYLSRTLFDVRSKIAGIFLLLILTVPIAATYTFFSLQIRQIRHEVKERILSGMDESKLTLLAFTKPEANHQLNWEDKHEFEYQGKMYDVVRMTTRGDSVFYWCWWDHKETQLAHELDTILNRAATHQSGQQKNQYRLLHFFNGLFCTDLAGLPAIAALRALQVIPEMRWIFHWHTPPPTPPPQFA